MRDSDIFRIYYNTNILPYLKILDDFFEKDIAIAIDKLRKKAGEIEAGDIEGYPGLSLTGFNTDAVDPAYVAEYLRDKAIDLYLDIRKLEDRINGLYCVELWSILERFIKIVELNYNDLKDIDEFATVETLRLVNNVVKHGEGKSLEELRLKRPDLLSGDDVSITSQTRKEFSSAIQKFIERIISK